MRRWNPALTLLVACLACGGGDSPSGPSGPGGPAGPAATIIAKAGNNQQGEPGQALSARPSVLVKDAADRPVPNVVVTFSVDSGGGTVSGANATTDASGTATAGEWKLGANEGRNTLLASVTGVAQIRFAAMGAFVPVVVASTSLGSAGGTLTVNRAGSPVHGLQVQVPNAAVDQSATFAVDVRSSAGIVLDNPAAQGLRSSASFSISGDAAAGNPAIMPLITLQVTGPQWSNAPVAIVIPLPLEIDRNILVAVLDSASRPIAFLPIVAETPTSITVTTRAFDWRMLRAMTGPPATPGSTTHSLTLAIFAVPGAPQINQILPTTLRVPFSAANAFPFTDLATAIAAKIDAGMVMAMHGGLPVYPGGIVGYGARAGPGLPISNTRGIMLSAGLSKGVDGWLGPNAAASIVAARTPWPQRYDYSLGIGIYYVLYYGYPLPLLLTDGVHTRMVLVLEWNSATSSFGVWDPAYSAIVPLYWTGSGMMPYQDPHDPSVSYPAAWGGGLQMAAAMWPWTYPGLVRLSAPASEPEPYREFFPVTAVNSWDSFIRGTPRWEKQDTLFMVGDTTRIWYSQLNAPFGFPTSLPMPAGHSLQTADVYAWDYAGQRWQYRQDYSGSYVFIDARPGGQGQWLEAPLGLSLRQLQGPGMSNTWSYFDRVDVVKYAMTIKGVQTSPTTASFTVHQPGGPQLPSDAKYQWNFGDGLGPKTVASPGNTTHTFNGTGPFKVTLNVLHASDNAVKVARAEMDYADISVSVSPSPLIAGPGRNKTLNAVIVGTPPAGIKYEWNYGDGTKRDTTNGPVTTHTYAAIGNYVINLRLLLNGAVLTTAPQAIAQVANRTGVWRLTNLTLVTFSLISPNILPNWIPGIIAIEGYTSQVIATPSDGIIFLDSPTAFAERAVYFHVTPPGLGATATYNNYYLGGFYTQLARDPASPHSSYNSTGTLLSGTITGHAFTGSVGTVLENSVSTQKNGEVMTGTFTIGPAPHWGGVRVFTFTAVLITP